MSWRNWKKWFLFKRSATYSAPRRNTFVPSVESLESRWLPHGGYLVPGPLLVTGPDGTPVPAITSSIDAASPAVGPLVPIANIPQLSSLPGAPATLFLNFLGNHSSTWWGWSEPANGVSVYDTDGDAATFNSTELADIQRTWAAVSEDYAAFNINVTTVAPAGSARHVAQIDVGSINSPWAGLGDVGGMDSSTGADPVHGWARYAEGSIVSHEAGHNMGLEHQSEYDVAGNKLNEYYAGEANASPIMGSGYTGISTWWYGTSVSATTYQNDANVIARSSNGFGYRVDDAGNSPAGAHAVTAIGTSFSGLGVIGPAGDVDFWSVSAGAGNFSVTVSVPAGINDLDVRLELRNASGAVLASSAPTNSYDATINTTVMAGTYYLVISGEDYRSDASDSSYPVLMGQYSISGTAALPTPDTAAPQASLTSAANVTQAGAAAYLFQITYTDNVGIDFTSLDNGDIRVTGPNGFTQTATFVSLSEATATYQITAPGGSWDLSDSGAYTIQVLARQVRDTSGNFVAAGALGTFQVSITPTLTTPILSLTAVSDTTATLSWTDTNVETGYDVYKDGAFLSSVAQNTTTTVVTGLAGGGSYQFSVQAHTASYAQIANSNTVIARTTTSSLVAPAQLSPLGAIAAASGFDKPTFTWSSVAAAHHYYLYVVDTTAGLAVINNPNVTGTSFTASQALTPGHSFSWYLGAISADGSINRYAPAGQSFTLANLAAPTLNGLSSTIAAATGYDMPAFSWNASAGANHYYLYLIDNTTGKPAIDNPNVNGLAYTATTAQALTPGHSFTWYVGAISTDGQVNSFLTAGRTFTLANLAAPTLNGLSGTIAASSGYDRPTFAWNAVTGASHYYLYVIDNTTGKAAIDNPNVNALSFRPSTTQALTPGHSFTWYVGAISTNGEANSYLTSGRNFSLAVLAAPTPIGPSGRITAAAPTFSWTSVAGADHYYLYVVDTTDALNQTVAIDRPTLSGTAFTPTTPLRSGHSYRWYIAAVSANALDLEYVLAGTAFNVA